MSGTVEFPPMRVGARRGTEAERDRAAIALAQYISGLLQFDAQSLAPHVREGLSERVTKLRRLQGLEASTVAELANRIRAATV